MCYYLYVTHLYTLAELGFSDSAYAAKYGHTLSKAAIDTLQKYKEYLTFGQGEGGMLAGPFFFGVSAEDIPNVDSMQVVMNVVMNEGKKANAPTDVMAAVRAIANVYTAHYVPWSAFESLACWYNCKIAGRKTADYHAFGEADVQTFCEIFDRQSNDGISNPAELYRKGVKEYLKY